MELLQSVLRKDSRASVHFIRAACSSMAAFIVEFCTLIFFKEFAGLHYITATIIGFVAGTLILYLLSIHWIFDKRKIPDAKIELPAFAGISAAALMANGGLMILFTEAFSIRYTLSRLIAAVIVFSGNFLLKKLTLFR